jgi:RNA recognition motif-containing protein
MSRQARAMKACSQFSFWVNHTNTHKVTMSSSVASKHSTATTASMSTTAESNTAPSSPKKKLIVLNLSLDTEEAELEFYCSHFDPDCKAFIPRTPKGENRGFGFVTFTSHENASEALQGLNGSALNHMILKVDWANEKPRKPRLNQPTEKKNSKRNGSRKRRKN